MAAPPSGTVTFMFTDIEASTRLWEERPDEMREMVARHDKRFRAVIEANSGYLVKGTGDGVHAAFGRAADAVVAAQELQAATADLPDLKVRIGINTGEAEEREGDYFGPAVNRAARLMALAHGGQVLVSSATERLLAGIELRDLGTHRLRDLSTPEHVYQLCGAGLETDFPQLRSLDSLPGNLPVQLTSFLGRNDELTMLQDLLARHRLVTLTGVGGVGKTRLSVQAAAETLENFPDGAWLCELAVAGDEDSMAELIVRALGCVQRPGLDLTESIVEYLKVRHLLLILDNCEHLLDEAGSLATSVLRRCPKVTVLATSREALGVDGERVVRVQSLKAPNTSASEDEVLQAAAVRLFTERAADAGANTSWVPTQLAAVAEICRRVDGIPLAIELAAARVQSMSPSDVAAHLDERFRLLTGRRRGRVERHQTLRATVEWSYQLLDESERAVFARLGVFAGTFDAAAAAAVASDDQLDRWRVLDAVGNLVAKSMVSIEDGPDGSSRYSMLETLRQFARERLDDAGDADLWRRRHADYYAALAWDVGRGLTGPEEFTWVARLQVELDNVRTAVAWAIDSDTSEERELGVRTVGGLACNGQLRIELSISGLAVLAADHVASVPPEVRVPVLCMAAYHWWHRGHPDKAQQLAREAVRDGILPLSPHPLQAHFSLMTIEASTGRPQAAVEVGNAARADLETLDSPYAECTFLATLAIWEAMAGQMEQSRADATRALERARRLQNPYSLASALHGTAWAYEKDDPVRALGAAEECIEIGRRSPVYLGSVESVLSLAAGLRSRLGDPRGALELIREATVIARDSGSRPQFVATLDWALSPLTKLGQADVAAVFLGALLEGAMVGVSEFPGVDAARKRMLERVRSVIGDDRADAAVAFGASLEHDEVVEYALAHLELVEAP